jgi:hypothetical protein
MGLAGSFARRVALALACATLLGGCAVSEESRRALARYSDAMQQVDQGAQQFLLDFSNGLKVQETHQALARGIVPAPPPEYPAQLKMPGPALPLTDAEKEVEATRQALMVVRAYNQALVALAESKPESELRGSLGELGGELQTLALLVGGVTLPALAPVVAIGAKLVKIAQDAANRQELMRAVLEGRQPVNDILAALESQAPVMYRLSVVGTTQAQRDLQADIQRAASALKTSVGQYAPPSDANIARDASDAQTELDRIGRQTKVRAAMPVPLPYAVGRPAYDMQAHSQTRVFVQAMASTAQKYGDVVAKQNAYHDLLQKYVLALRATRGALDKLAESLVRPADLRGEAARLLKAAFELRDAMAAYRTPPASAP